MIEVGNEMKEYLSHDSTDRNLKLLSKIQIDLRGSPLRTLLVDEPTIQEFIDDDDVTARVNSEIRFKGRCADTSNMKLLNFP